MYMSDFICVYISSVCEFLCIWVGVYMTILCALVLYTSFKITLNLMHFTVLYI